MFLHWPHTTQLSSCSDEQQDAQVEQLVVEAERMEVEMADTSRQVKVLELQEMAGRD